MKKSLLLSLLLVVVMLVAGCGGSHSSGGSNDSGSGGGGGGGGTGYGAIKVVNNASTSIYYVYIKRSSSSDWGVDQLGTRTISPGASFLFVNVPVGSWDVRAKMSSGNTYSAYNCQVVDGGIYTVTNGPGNNKAAGEPEPLPAGKTVSGDSLGTSQFVGE